MSIQFHTQFDIPTQPGLFAINEPILTWGSCFADEMAKRMQDMKCWVDSNSHGIIFHAGAINKAITDVVENKLYETKDLFYHQELWHSWHHHGSFSNVDAQLVLDQINAANQLFHNKIKQAKLVILTLGTAWVYKLKEQDIEVANCHKMPGSAFIKQLQSVSAIKLALQDSISKLQNLNPELRIILTVSPVRYLKDGIVENSRSKAHLLCAVHEMLETNERCYYFSAYELMVDDLRDYRFMASDLSHPSADATDYIWEKFLETYLKEADKICISEIKSLLQLTAHRPLHHGTSQFKVWKDKCTQFQTELQLRYPELRWE